jgi:dihydroorotase
METTDIKRQPDMQLLFRSVFIIDPESAYNGQRLDVLVDNGLIRQIGAGLTVSENVRVIDGENLHLSPGWFDLRASAGDPGTEHREDLTSLAQTAAAGGFTDVALLPNTNPVIDDKGTLNYIRRRAEWQPAVIHPVAAITKGAKGVDFTDMIDLHHAGAVAFSDGIHSLTNPDLLLKTLQYLQPIGALLINHAEEPMLSRFGQMHEGIQSTLLGLKGLPAMAEEIAIERDLQILAYVLEGKKEEREEEEKVKPMLHFSCLSSARSVELIRQAKVRGLPVSADVAAHQLVFTDEALSGFDTNLKVNPPFRGANDVAALWAGLADNTIDAVVSDHQPQDEESKNSEFDIAEFGMISLETVFVLLMSNNAGRLSLAQLVDKLSVAPRRLLRLARVVIAEGQPATLTVFDPSARWIFEKTRSKSKNSPFFGQSFTGCVVGTVHNGHFYQA